jgi:hypothetical protein
MPLRRLQRSTGHLVARQQRGQLRVGRDGTGRESGHELAHGGALPVEDKIEHVVR